MSYGISKIEGCSKIYRTGSGSTADGSRDILERQRISGTMKVTYISNQRKISLKTLI